MADTVGMTKFDVDLSGALFHKSSKSGDTGDCVEVATNIPGIVAIRDSKDPSGALLRFTPAEWAAFKDGVVNGEF